MRRLAIGSRERKMEMRASEGTEIGQDVTPPLLPLAFSLYDSHLLSHCSSCFSPLPNPPFLPTFPINSHPIPNPTILYCSAQCSSSDSPLHLSSSEHHLLQSHSATCHPADDSSDIRLALRLLFLLCNTPISPRNYSRLSGLLTNRERFMSRDTLDDDDEVLMRIRNGAKAMATARRRRDGEGVNEDLAVEEAAFCLVLTNAVEVQANGRNAIGVAVYDTSFSWINHSCSPNACYRFLAASREVEKEFNFESQLRIVPGGGEGDLESEADGVCRENGLGRGNKPKGYGPRIIVRSIKAIKKGEKVTIAYTDLLQPKAIRQSELWLKYRFICCCSRCNALPPTYVDHALQEILAANPDSNSLSSEQIVCRDKAIRKMTNYVEDAITEYLSVGNPESCCEKLENILFQGLLNDEFDKEEVKYRSSFRLHPLHSLSLNAYTALASAYKMLAHQLLAAPSEASGHQLEAFNISRIAAAYSFLLASATHYLFRSEPSLIASLVNFWTTAGESLLGLARSSVWNFIMKWDSPVSNRSSIHHIRCNKCSLMDTFEAYLFCSRSRNVKLEEISREFHNCITHITQQVWTILTRGCGYLTLLRDPIILSWVDTVKSVGTWDVQGFSGKTIADSIFETESSVSNCEYTIEERVNLFQLGCHCIVYGGFLSSICYGQQSYSTSYIRDLLYGEKKAENLI